MPLLTLVAGSVRELDGARGERVLPTCQRRVRLPYAHTAVLLGVLGLLKGRNNVRVRSDASLGSGAHVDRSGIMEPSCSTSRCGTGKSPTPSRCPHAAWCNADYGTYSGDVEWTRMVPPNPREGARHRCPWQLSRYLVHLSLAADFKLAWWWQLIKRPCAQMASNTEWSSN